MAARTSPLRSPQTARKGGFTLVELLVSLVILSILAGLSLSGLAASRRRAKIDKTKSTIRKLHEIVTPQYESYATRRVAIGGVPAPSRPQCPTCYADGDANMSPSRTAVVAAWKRLVATRRLLVEELPDQWASVYPAGGLPGGATAPPRRYADYHRSLSPPPTPLFEGAECLAMIVTRGGFAVDATELFRTDEIGDLDQDGAPEFRDGWGRPIHFLRWAAGFPSAIHIQDAGRNPDPLDPLGVSAVSAYPGGAAQPDYGLTPLIFSSGPDGAMDDPLSPRSGYGVDATYVWLQNLPILTTRAGSPVAGQITDAGIAADNITNHDLITK